MNSTMFSLSTKDFAKGVVMAVLSGMGLPVLAVLQTPDFNILTADWHQIGILTVNGAILGFVAYVVKNFLSTEDGKFVGSVG